MNHLDLYYVLKLSLWHESQTLNLVVDLALFCGLIRSLRCLFRGSIVFIRGLLASRVSCGCLLCGAGILWAGIRSVDRCSVSWHLSINSYDQI